MPYDTLVLATGARHAYFGHDEWEPFAPGLKTLEDATTIRRRILLAFEQAELETDPRARAALLTFVIIGAGPTGVELAGTIAELARDTLPRDFRNIDTRTARVVLIEAGPRVLAGFADGSVGLCAALAGRASASRSCWAGRSPTAPPTASSMAASTLAAQDDHLGRRRARLARRRMAGRAGRPRRPPAGRARSHRAGPSGDLRHRRHRDDRRAGRQAGARHRAGRQAAGPPRRRHHQGAAARRHAGAAVPLPARRQPGARSASARR